MTKEDLLNKIPNQSNVDILMVDRVYKLYKALKRFEENLEIEDLVHEQASREGDARTVSNPFWKEYAGMLKLFSTSLSELGLTPKSRRQLLAQETIAKGTIPTLGKK